MKGAMLLRGLVASKGIFRVLTWGLLGFFFLYLFISAGIVAYQERDVSVFIQEIGEEMAKPLQKAQEVSLEVIEDKESNLWDSIWKYWGFYFNLYKIYLWIWVLMFFVNLVLKDSNAPMIRYLLAIAGFFMIQMLFSLAFFPLETVSESLTAPFKSTSDIFKAIGHIFTNFR